MKIEKVDAHHHLWSVNSPHFPMMRAPGAERFIGNTGRLKHDFGPEQFLPLAAAQNVTRSVYVESHFSPPLEETAFVQAIADTHGLPSAIVGRADLGAPELGAELDIHMRSPLFRGVRSMVNWDDDPGFRSAPRDGLLREEAWREGFAELGRRGLVAEVMALPAQLADLAELAARTPATALVVGHAGMPVRRTGADETDWREGMRALSALPNVTVKISGLGMVDHRWSAASIAPIVSEIIDLFGAGRCMFASNFPVDALYGTYNRIWDAFDDVTADLPADAREALFSATARRVFRI